MATDDQQVLVTGQADAPASFRVPGNGQIQPKAVFASFDGSGAAGDFLPALRIVSDGGETIGVYPTSSAVAAGASADVSWFPRVAAGAAATPTTFQAPFASLYIVSPQTVASGALNSYLSMQGGVTGGFETSDSSIFVNAQNTGLSGNPWGIKCLANGTYLIGENYFVRSGTAGARFTTYHTLSGGNTVSFYQPGRTGALVGDTWDRGASGVHTFFWELSDATTINPAPLYINPYANLQSGANITVEVQTVAYYLGPYAGGII